ncbi:unnamed protein product, partial [Musa hybrid cultivar]
QVPGRLFLQQGLHKLRRYRHGGSVEVERPDGDVLVPLETGGKGGGESDPLVHVGGVGAEAVVVEADVAVGVEGGDGDMHDGGEEAVWGGGEVELVDGGVLDVEAGFGRAEEAIGHDATDGEADGDAEGDRDGQCDLHGDGDRRSVVAAV